MAVRLTNTQLAGFLLGKKKFVRSRVRERLMQILRNAVISSMGCRRGLLVEQHHQFWTIARIFGRPD